MYCPPGYVDSNNDENGAWRLEQTPLNSVGRLSSNVAKRAVYENRDILANYLVSEKGQVPWQNKMVNI